MTCPSFTSEHILAAILFENTMERKVKGEYTADYLWNQKGILPILEPEVDIKAFDKAACEVLLKAEIKKHLAKLTADEIIMFKLTIPSIDDFYSELMEDPHVLRIVALSGGYTRDEANEKLARNPGLIASFSRALSQGLCVTQSDEEFDALLKSSIQSIYDASIT